MKKRKVYKFQQQGKCSCCNITFTAEIEFNTTGTVEIESLDLTITPLESKQEKGTCND